MQLAPSPERRILDPWFPRADRLQIGGGNGQTKLRTTPGLSRLKAFRVFPILAAEGRLPLETARDGPTLRPICTCARGCRGGLLPTSTSVPLCAEHSVAPTLP